MDILKAAAPEKLEDIIGQEHLLGKNGYLKKLIESGKLHSFLIYGPPGSGKTSLLRIIERKYKDSAFKISASTTPFSMIRKIIMKSKEYGKYGKKMILLVDEIHNIKRNDQRIFLEPLENGYIILIAATTESPSKYIINPLLSRIRIYHFKKLSEDVIVKILKKSLKKIGKDVDDDILRAIAKSCDGDARQALISLQSVLEGGKEQVKAIFSKKEHYDLISAFIKSVRGSDPDASIYYLARMLKLGEDPRFIARRLLILASEDIGLADPHALPIASAAAQAVEYVGLPEAEIILAHATIYLALASKSNSAYKALKRAKEVAEKPAEVPKHLKNLPESGYKYPHDFGGWIEQRYLPENIEGPFYIPTPQDPKNWIEKIKKGDLDENQ